jgi:MFS family permease
VTLGALGAAGVTAVGFVSWERRVSVPLLPSGTLANRPLVLGVLVSLVLTAATTPPFFLLTLHLQTVLGWSPTATGLGSLPVVLAVVAGASAAPRLIAARGAAAVMTGGLVLIATGAAVLTGISPSGGFVTAVLPGQALYGFGLGASSVAATTAGTAALPAARQGLASGLLNTAAQLGTALGLAVLVAIAAASEAPVDGFRAAFAADALLTASAALMVAFGARALRVDPSDRDQRATDRPTRPARSFDAGS